MLRYKWISLRRVVFFLTFLLFVKSIFLLTKRNNAKQRENRNHEIREVNIPKYYVKSEVILNDEYILRAFRNVSESYNFRRNTDFKGHYWTYYKNISIPDLVENLGKDGYSHVEFCPSDTYLAVFVHIQLRTYEHWNTMQKIREHWQAHLDHPIRRIQLYFLIAKNGPYEKTTAQMLRPSKIHQIIHGPPHDIIQVNLIDHYLNLTLKTIAMVKWTSLYCKSAKYILKIDDDTFINATNLLKQLKYIEYIGHEHLIFGDDVGAHAPPKTGDGFDTWQINNAIYPLIQYPNYTEGYFYMYTNNITPKLLRRILMPDTPVLNIEDIFLTGIVRVKEQISMIKFPLTYNRCWEERLKYHKLVAVHHYSYLEKNCSSRRPHIQKPNKEL